jgi:hypothetical protein
MAEQKYPQAEDYDNHGFGVEALVAIATALQVEGFACSVCGCADCHHQRNPGNDAPCLPEHFFPQAEKCLMIMSHFAVHRNPQPSQECFGGLDGYDEPY